MLADLVDSLLSAEHDFKIVGRHVAGKNVLHEARLARADVIVFQQGNPTDPHCVLDELIVAQPLAVLAIAENGLGGELYRLANEAVSFDPTSGGLVAAIRVAARELG
jgi:DNA-binding NarL/FixJ family response regulator